MQDLLEQHQVKIYFVVIFIGIVLGSTTSINPQGLLNPALALMLFATFLQVPITTIGKSFTNIRFISCLLVTNFIALPILTAVLLQFLPSIPLVKLAVAFVLLAPCIDYVITFTNVGKGNAKQLVAMTPILLLMQMVLLPVYLHFILGSYTKILIQFQPFLHAFLWFIILPLICAFLVQRFKPIPVLNSLPVPATALVLLIVFASVMPQIGLAQSAALAAVPIYISYAILAPCVGWLIAKKFKLDHFSSKAISFSASYRNSFVILPLAFAIPHAMPIVPAVILTQTIVELLFLPIYLKIIEKKRL